MKGDNSRDTFQREKHYRNVRMQQGRVQIDADWNELADIVDYLLAATAGDIIGGPAAVGAPPFPVGAPPAPGQGAFAVTPTSGSPNNLQIAPGRLYVDGVLAELNQPPSGGTFLYTQQPDLPMPGAPFPAFNTGAFPFPALINGQQYLAYLDVWQRHITAIEDPLIREVALGGPDTATRSQTVAQVKLFPVTGGTACGASIAAFDTLTAPSSGKLSAQAVGTQAAPTACDVSTAGGFTGLQNQLYRVEVHQGGSLPGTVTFKWSRDNGSVVAALSPTANPPSLLNPVIILQSPPADEAHGFSVGQWVELTDDKIDLQGRGGVMVKLTAVDGTTLTFNPASATNPDNTATPPTSPPGGALVDLTAKAKVRRWDQNVAMLTASTSGPFDLESGIQVRFAGGTYRTGDYWTIPARTAIGTATGIEWPTDPLSSPAGQPRLVSPKGIVHRYVRLAMVTFAGSGSGGTFAFVSDCRRRLPGLSTLTADDVAFNNTPNLTLSTVPATVANAINQLAGSITAPNAINVIFTPSACFVPAVGNVAAALEQLCARFANFLPLTGGTLSGGLTVNGSIAVTGTVDGRDVSVDGTNLTNHIAAVNNPHNTTAAQVNALALAGGTLTGDVTTSANITTSNATARIRDQKARTVVTSTTPTSIQNSTATQTFVQLMTTSVTVQGAGNNPVQIRFSVGGVSLSGPTGRSDADFQITVDGTQVAFCRNIFLVTPDTESRSITLERVLQGAGGLPNGGLSAGAHTVVVNWSVRLVTGGPGTVTANVSFSNDTRELSIVEL
jgi:hypothetical protein